MTYQELKNAIAAMLSRPNMNQADILIPLFIMMAEGRLNTKLRVEDAAILISVPTVAGQGTYNLPTQALSLRWVKIEGGSQGQQDLELLTPTQLSAMFPRDQGGYPSHFARIARELWVRKIPNSSEWTLSYQYYSALPALSDTNPQNWLGDKYPHVYIWQAMAYASHNIKDYAARDSYQAQADSAIDELKLADARDEFSGGTPGVLSL